MRNYLYNIVNLLVVGIARVDYERDDVSCAGQIVNGMYIIKTDLHIKKVLKIFNELVELEVNEISSSKESIRENLTSDHFKIELEYVKTIIASIKELDSGDIDTDGFDVAYTIPLMNSLMYKNVSLSEYVAEVRYMSTVKMIKKYGRENNPLSLLPHTEEEISLINKWINQEK